MPTTPDEGDVGLTATTVRKPIGSAEVMAIAGRLDLHSVPEGASREHVAASRALHKLAMKLARLGKA